MSLRLLLIVSILLIVTPADAGRPSRSECIIGYVLDWSDVPNAKPDRVQVTRGFDLVYNNREWMWAFAGFMLNYDLDRLYMQFGDQCDRKEEFARIFIEYHRAKGLKLPKFIRIPDPIKPSTDTIELKGPEWSDGGSGPGYVLPDDIDLAPTREHDL